MYEYSTYLLYVHISRSPNWQDSNRHYRDPQGENISGYPTAVPAPLHAYTLLEKFWQISLLLSSLWGAHTKRPETKRPKMKRPQTKRPKDKKCQGTKRPKGFNVPRDKKSQGTKRTKGQNVPRDKTSQGQDVLKDKTSQGSNEAHYLTSVAYKIKIKKWPIIPIIRINPIHKLSSYLTCCTSTLHIWPIN